MIDGITCSTEAVVRVRILGSRLMKLEELVPVRIIHFDPVIRKIVEPKNSEFNCLAIGNPTPQFFDLGYVYYPYVPKQNGPLAQSG